MADMGDVDFLGGRIVVERGTIADYRGLSHLHYVPGDPATMVGVWRAVYAVAGGDAKARVVAVGVLSYPTPASRARERALRLGGPRYGGKLTWINANLRTISRVIVHPQFRSLGIASALVRRMCDECPVRYVEALAAMGDVHPFFEKGGMRKVEAGYFLLDRELVTV